MLSYFAGNGTYGLATAGPALSSQIGPTGLAVDGDGNVYVANRGTAQVVKVTPSGTLSIIAGDGTAGDPVPGPATSSPMISPEAVAVDASGNVYVADTSGLVVVKVTPSGTLSIVAGNGRFAGAGQSAPGPATNIKLVEPNGLVVDGSGNLVILDGYRVLKVTPEGSLSIVAGTGSWGVPAAGTATATAVGSLEGLAIDGSGNLYFGDIDNYFVLKVTPAGALSIVAGNGEWGDLTPGPATSSPMQDAQGLAVDADGNLIIAFPFNYRLAKLTPAGTLSFIAGNGSYGAPTPGSAMNSRLAPSSVVIDPSGSMFVVQFPRVLKLTPPASAPSAPTGLLATVGDGSASVSFTPGSDGGAPITGYQYQVGFGGSWVEAGSSSPIAVTGLANYTKSSIRIRAVNEVGPGAASAAVQVWPRRASSSLTSVVAFSGSRLRVAFDALVAPGISTRHHWVFAYTKGTSTVVSSCRAAVFLRQCVLQGLSPNTEYDVVVRGFFTVSGSRTVLPTLDSARVTRRTRA
jgi:sugar lactone lactonase YvrE